MKKIIILATAMLLTVSAFAQDGKSIYQKYSDSRGVSSVYVSPSMFRLMKRIPDIDLGREDVNLSSIIKSLDGLYIIDAENSSIGNELQKDVDRFVRKGAYELLMEAKDDGDVVRMYTVGNDKVITSFVLLALEPDECTFICFSGQIPREELENTIGAVAAHADR